MHLSKRRPRSSTGRQSRGCCGGAPRKASHRTPVPAAPPPCAPLAPIPPRDPSKPCRATSLLPLCHPPNLSFITKSHYAGSLHHSPGDGEVLMSKLILFLILKCEIGVTLHRSELLILPGYSEEAYCALQKQSVEDEHPNLQVSEPDEPSPKFTGLKKVI